MLLSGAAGQQTVLHRAYRLDGSITTASVPQLVTPIPVSRSSYLFHNSSSSPMYLEFGSARGIATISNGAVTGVTITNGGFGFLFPPNVSFQGGTGYSDQVSVGQSGAGLPGYAAPSNAPNNYGGRPAQGFATISGGVVTGVTITDGGAGYVFAPYVDFTNRHADRYGCASPYYNSTNSGQIIAANGSDYVNGTFCTMEQISVWCATAGATYMFKWSP